jgi:hypothetical protein
MISSNLHLEEKHKLKVYKLKDGKIAVSITNDYFDDFTIISDKKVLKKLLLEALMEVSEVQND